MYVFWTTYISSLFALNERAAVFCNACLKSLTETISHQKASHFYFKNVPFYLNI